MRIKKNKIIVISIASVLLLSMTISLSSVNAATYPIPGTNDRYDDATYTAIQQGMYWVGMDANASATRLLLWNRFHDLIPTHVYVLTAPSPIGVGQTDNIVMFNPQQPPDASLINSIRYKYTLTIARPDGRVDQLPSGSTAGGKFQPVAGGAFVSDSTGTTYYLYTPDAVGNYSVTVNFLQFQFLWNTTNNPGGTNDYYGTTFLASNYTKTLIVQQDPVSLTGLEQSPYSPVPTAFWTRPIEGENTMWYQVASNWLSNDHDRDNGGPENRYQPDGTAPNTGHILWTRPTEDMGVLGGSNTAGIYGQTFNAGSQYQPRFMNQIIMYGRLYYSPNIYTVGASDFMDCVDLKTGELIYRVNTTDLLGQQFSIWSYSVSQGLSNYWFGYYYDQEAPNEHGIDNPGWIFTPNYAKALQPATGIVSPIKINNVPSTNAMEIQGPHGENLRYVFTNKGNTSNPNWYLSQWNSSRTIPQVSANSDPSTAPIDGSLASRFDWNMSSPIQFTTTPTPKAAKLGDILWGFNGTWPAGSGAPSYAYPSEVTVWGISLNPSNIGQLIYMKNIPIDDPVANTNFIFRRADADSNIFIIMKSPDQSFIGYDMHTGNRLWETDAQADSLTPYGYYTWSSLISVTQTKTAYGLLYVGGYTSSVSAYNLTTGKLVWRDNVIPPDTAGTIKSSPAMLALICDGKIYVGTHEHSALTPLEPGNNLKCYNATTGEPIWQMTGWVYPESIATADGVLIYWNDYDGQIYGIGQGPTKLTVSAPQISTELGKSVVISGAVTDISVGSQQTATKANFPNGLPAVSDDSMSQWMEYVYMQKQVPSNATGVPVSIDVLDSNNNYRHIVDTTTDASGMFSYQWTPDIPGKYTVYATFKGTQSYYGSYSQTTFAVDSQATPAPTTIVQTESSNTTQMYIIGGVVAIIIAIAIGFAITILTLRKKP